MTALGTRVLSCPTPCDPIDCNPPDSSAHGIFQARVLDWVATPFSRGSSWPMDRTHLSCVSCIGRKILYHWATWEANVLNLPKISQWKYKGKKKAKQMREIEIDRERELLEKQSETPFSHFSDFCLGLNPL